MKRSPILFFLFVGIIAVTASGTITLGQRYPLGIMPSALIKVENSSGKYFVTLVKGDSELVVFDTSFRPLTIFDSMKNDGINDLIYRDGKLYCFGFYSGRVIVVDVSGHPSKWKKIDEIPTSSRLITGSFIDGKVGMLTNDFEFLLLDISRREIIKRQKLPVIALSIAEDSEFFFVSLFHNYNLLTNSHETEKGLLVFDEWGNLIKEADIGKRPSYILLGGEKIFLVSYVEENLKILSKSDLTEITSVQLGKYPNFPVIHNGKIWIALTGEDQIMTVDLATYRTQKFDLMGRGPMKVVHNGDRIYVLETITGTLEVLDSRGNTIEYVELDGYPVDIVFSGKEAAVLLQEDWQTGKNTGALLVLKTN
ncbi:YncE family protein [Mesotoga sp.]|uniref:YncE family protein n=1 Tax=Mesotoga sp. TaxID=2053577 RepID=UPI00345E080D